MGRLKLGERFGYEYDFGDEWLHLCTVAEERVDPLETLGIVPDRPLPYWGWGDLPDQYGRHWDGDDGESPPPPDTRGADLPPLHPFWDRYVDVVGARTPPPWAGIDQISSRR